VAEPAAAAKTASSLAKTAEVATLGEIEASDLNAPRPGRMNWTACWAAASSKAAWC
jgi:hypothetical protein